MAEIYHGFEPVLAYDQAGSDRGNQWKAAKELPSYTADALDRPQRPPRHPPRLHRKTRRRKESASAAISPTAPQWTLASWPAPPSTPPTFTKASDKSMSDDSLTRSCRHQPRIPNDLGPPGSTRFDSLSRQPHDGTHPPPTS